MKIITSVISICAILLVVPSIVQASSSEWRYNAGNKAIYSVYKTKDNAGWTTHVVLEVYSDTILFSALIPRAEYNKIFTFNPNTYLKWGGEDLVKHDTFFWGDKGQSIEFDIDGLVFNCLALSSSNEYQIKSSCDYEHVIQAMKNGNVLTLNKHFFKENGDKGYPTFSLKGFTAAYNKQMASMEQHVTPDYPEDGLMCRKEGNRNIVWINTPSHGSYALNGPAIEWVQSSKKLGAEIQGADGKPMKIGRDHIPPSLLNDLIQKGLQECR